jgi:hypothetical protein
MKNGKHKPTRMSYSVLETINTLPNASFDAVTDLRDFIEFLDHLSHKASKKTHYHELDYWRNATFGFVREKLTKYGFINGDPEANAKNSDATFWWKVYSILSNVIYSPHLKSEVTYHHSSAYERNEALILEIEDVLSSITIK